MIGACVAENAGRPMLASSDHRRFRPLLNSASAGEDASLPKRAFQLLAIVALVYAFLAGLRTVTDFDVGWQLATGRWIVQHHQIPSNEIFSYTAQGQPWIYPAGSALLFYGIYLLGGYSALSWFGAAVSAGTVALLLRRGSAVTAALAVVAIPRIAQHTTPRADMFSILLFAAFLSLLWEEHETGRARLWLLPILMIAWVNLHLGFVAGFTLLCAYLSIELLEMLWPERCKVATERLQRCWPWFLATVAATLANPWAWGIYQALLRQNAVMAEHSQWIIEWGSARLSWAMLPDALMLRNPGSAFYTMLLLAGIAVFVALLRRQVGAAVLLAGAAWLSIRHVRFQGLFAVTLVLIAGAVLQAALAAFKAHIADTRLRSILVAGAMAAVIILAGLRSADLVTDRTYLQATDLGQFGGGLSWWFPERAAAFIEREKLPGEIFNSYNEGGFLVWRLGEKYRDYIDGRAIPFGPELFQRNGALLQTPPDSPDWQAEAERYNLNVLVVPLARYNALQFFPLLPQFCASQTWRPVYMDEVSAVFVRRNPLTEAWRQRLQIDCATAPLPSIAPAAHSSQAFNQWANAAAVLQALGRDSEAFDATTRALDIFPESAFVHFLRGTLLHHAGNLPEAEKEYRVAADFEPNAATWSALADLYHNEKRLDKEIEAREQAVEYLPRPGLGLLSLGYAYLSAHRPQDALRAFDKAQSSLPENGAADADNSFRANLAHGRAAAWMALGDLGRAITAEEETVRLTPDRATDWLLLANWYERAGRLADAQQARARAEALQTGPQP